jgi:hypothetical protein
MLDLQLRVSVFQTRSGWRGIALTEVQKGAAGKKRPSTSPKKKTEE